MANEPPAILRLVLIEHCPKAAQALWGGLDMAPGVKIVASCGSVAELYPLYYRLKPDAAVLAIDPDDTSAYTTLIELAQHLPQLHLAIGALKLTPRHAMRASFYGATSFLSADTHPVTLGMMLHLAQRGAMVLSPSVANHVRSMLFPNFGALSRRELLIVKLLADGTRNSDIASALDLSPRTVESHILRICAKLGLETRLELVTWWLRQMDALNDLQATPSPQQATEIGH